MYGNIRNRVVKNLAIVISVVLLLMPLGSNANAEDKLPILDKVEKSSSQTQDILVGDQSPKWFDSFFGMEDSITGLVQKITKLTSITDYIISPGDTITSISKNTRISVETLLSYNQIKSPRTLKPGQILKIPAENGVLITVEQPTTIAELSKTYSVYPEVIWLANPTKSMKEPVVGDIFVPGGKMDPKELRKALGEYFLWPTKGGRISSFFGQRKDPFSGVTSNHTGLDIANTYGAPVLAAGSGTVVMTGYDRILGNHIKVDQGQGFLVVYGHLSKINTEIGYDIKEGTKIGEVGSSGYSTGPHLHFSAYRWGKLLNPMALFG